jgi:type II restriction enzyme
MRLTASDIVRAIGLLPKDRAYQYVNPRTRGQIRIMEVIEPEGPIVIRRCNPSQGESFNTAEDETISLQMIWRIANSFFPNQPINFERVLGGSYNTRSVLEALLVHTPQFYFCYPGRIEMINSSTEVKGGHKHVMWCPDSPHESGVMKRIETELVISEIPNTEIVYDALVLPDDLLKGDVSNIDVQRRHAQIQIALIEIGQQLGFRTWIAQNDKGILYKDKKIGEMQGVVASLRDEKLMSAFEDAHRAALLIDCIWFKNGKLMPAVMEVEHSTGVTSGLTRMKGLQDAIPFYQDTRYVIVAPDEDRDKVIKEACRPQFLPLKTRYFPYSAVEELYALCKKRKIRGINDEFLDCYMEPVTQLLA